MLYTVKKLYSKIETFMATIMPKEKTHRCEVCGRNPAVSICLRCRRLVCDECMASFGLCRDCYALKRVIENDRINLLDYIYRMSLLCRDHIDKYDKCSRCIILREMLISLYKMLKDLSHEAKKEYFEEILKKIKTVEPMLRRLLVRVIIMQGGLRLPEIEISEEKDFTFT